MLVNKNMKKIVVNVYYIRNCIGNGIYPFRKKDNALVRSYSGIYQCKKYKK